MDTMFWNGHNVSEFQFTQADQNDFFFKQVQTCTFLAVSNSADSDPKVFLVYICLLEVETRRKKELMQML